MFSTLKDLSVMYAKKQPEQVDLITEDAPILGNIPFRASTHDFWNTYEDLSDVGGAGWVDFDAPLPEVYSESELKKMDLDVLGGIIEVGEDKARAWGSQQAYFAAKMPSILRKSGMTSEDRILYSNLKQFAIDQSKAVSSGASGNDTYDIIAVKWVEGETQGLYSPKNFEQGAILNAMPVNGGNLYKATYKGTNNVLVYGLRLKSYFGLQLANRKYVSVISNITKSNLPTSDMIDDLIVSVRGSAANVNSKVNTWLYTHPKVFGWLNKYKAEKLNLVNVDKERNNEIVSWNNIPILTSYNFKTVAATTGLPTDFDTIS